MIKFNLKIKNSKRLLEATTAKTQKNYNNILVIKLGFGDWEDGSADKSIDYSSREPRLLPTPMWY